jgi:hypothetical protein
MKNLNFYPLDSFEFHKKAIAAKKVTKVDADIRTRLTALNGSIETLYKAYEVNFNANTLQELNAHGYIDNEKSDLLSLYSFKSKIVQTFKAGITTTATNRIVNTCQNCTIGEVSSFDHVLPKEEFAEFVINPLNLFPSCSVCNSAKGKYWLENGERLYLNLYLDNLPDLQYLFVNIDFSDGVFTTEFYLDNPNGIDASLFSLIKRHYTRLKLPQRFSDNNDAVIPTLQNKIKPYIGKLNLQMIIDTTIEQSQLNRDLYGFNYWQSVLELELLKNQDFLDTLL